MRTFPATALLALALLTASCAHSPGLRATGERSACCASNTPSSAAATLPGQSLYQVTSMWTDDSGRVLPLAKLRGRPQIVAMFFAHCTSACPLIVRDLKRIEEALPPGALGRIGFTLITLDPARDTPDALHTYRLARKLEAPRWTLLNGSPDDTMELAALLGVKFRTEPDGQISHSNLISVLNAEGEIIHQLTGLNQDIQETVSRAVKAALP